MDKIVGFIVGIAIVGIAISLIIALAATIFAFLALAAIVAAVAVLLAQLIVKNAVKAELPGGGPEHASAFVTLELRDRQLWFGVDEKGLKGFARGRYVQSSQFSAGLMLSGALIVAFYLFATLSSQTFWRPTLVSQDWQTHTLWICIAAGVLAFFATYFIVPRFGATTGPSLAEIDGRLQEFMNHAGDSLAHIIELDDHIAIRGRSLNAGRQVDLARAVRDLLNNQISKILRDPSLGRTIFADLQAVLTAEMQALRDRAQRFSQSWSDDPQPRQQYRQEQPRERATREEAPASNDGQMTLDKAHRILGVPVGTAKKDIRSVYLALVKVWHSDVRPNKDDTQIKQINAAWDYIERSKA